MATTMTPVSHNSLTPVVSVPLTLLWRNSETAVHGDLNKLGSLCVVNDAGYLKNAVLRWEAWEAIRTWRRPLFNWVSAFNFNVDAVTMVLDLEGDAQALMLVRAQHTVRCDAGQRGPLLYVGFLEVAPWNKEDAVPRVLRGVGPTMLRLACYLSAAQGCNGRIGLHSVEAAEGFYRRLGFCSHDCPNEYNELYLELDEVGAAALLKD
jgi:hypothetical protein